MDPLELGALAAVLREVKPLAKPLIDVAAKLLWRLLGKPASAGADRLAAMLAPPPPRAATIADAVTLWKSANVVVILSKAAEAFERDGVELVELPRDFLIPMLEAAAYAEDDDVQAFFARLLVSSVRDATHRHPMILHVLRQLSGEDAREFRAACARADALGIEFGDASHAPFWGENFHDDVHVRLDALRLVVHYSEPPTTTPDEGSRAPSTSPDRHIVPSEFGWRFREAVFPRGCQ